MTGTPDPTFRLMLGNETRLEASPQEWAAWMDVLSPGGFKALVLLAEPVADDFNGEPGWEERLLCTRGMDLPDAIDGVFELRSLGYLSGTPQRLSDLPGRPPMPTRVYKPQPRCLVCGGSRPSITQGLITYVAERSGYLKVGMTRNLAARLAVLDSDQPGVLLPPKFDLKRRLSLVGTTQEPEHDVHEWLAGHHVTGEWFDDTPAVRKALGQFAGLK